MPRRAINSRSLRGDLGLAVLHFALLLLPSLSYGTWIMSWNDEFDGNTLNDTLWDIEVHPPGWVNDELEGYTEEDVLIENGNLVLRAQKRNYTSPDGWTANYTSGRINTQSKMVQLYGKVEVRAKVPKGDGFWPAIWMLPGTAYNYCWPEGGEIDITEVLGQETTRPFQTYHFGKICDVNNQKGNNITTIDLSLDFHVYSAIWESGKVVWFLDGQETFHLSHKAVPFLPPSPMGVILNLAVGGNWPVAPNNSTKFPNYFLVDYVRVYHRETN